MFSFFFSFFPSASLNSQNILQNWFSKLLGSEVIFIGRARVGLFLAARLIQREQKGVCLLSPLTILDVVNMLSASGAELEYLDLKKDFYEIDIDLLKRRLLLGDVNMLVVTHYFYIQPNIEEIVEVCRFNNVSIIEDCAISLGAKINGKSAGSFGRFSIFSFSLFKFLNSFWGGAIFCQNELDSNKIKLDIQAWRQLNFYEYIPQLMKYMKFWLVTFQPFLRVIFPFFKYGIKNNIQIIVKNVQNDPVVPYTSQVEANCLSLPHPSLYIELARKITHLSRDMEWRQINAFYLYKNINNKKLIALPDRLDFNSASLISFPLLFNSMKERNIALNLLLDIGVDCSKQLYRNVSQTAGFRNIPGETFNTQNLIERSLFIPIHKSVSLVDLKKICKKINHLN